LAGLSTKIFSLRHFHKNGAEKSESPAMKKWKNQRRQGFPGCFHQQRKFHFAESPPNNFLPQRIILDKGAIKQKRVFEKFSGNRARFKEAADCPLIFSLSKTQNKKIREVAL
jgi:hypothetical protein